MTPFSTRKESPSPITVRLPKVARRQLDDLAQLWGENQSQAIIRCLERVWTAEVGTAAKTQPRRSVFYKEKIMSTKITRILSVDESIELALYPASVVIGLPDKVAQVFDAAVEKEKSASWLPVWKQIKGALLTAGQFMGHRFADKMLEIPLEAVVEISLSDSRLQILSERGNEVQGQYNLNVGNFDLEIEPGGPGVFDEGEVREFARRFAEVKPLYLDYLSKLGVG
jgi:hypothetical protein